MTEGNFTDYVKVFVTSGNGAKALYIYIKKNSLPKEVLMVAMEDEEDTLLFVEIKIFGLLFILNFKNTSELGTVAMEEEAVAQELTGKMFT